MVISTDSSLAEFSSDTPVIEFSFDAIVLSTNRLVIIEVSVIVGEALCAEAIDAEDEMRIKNKIRVVDDNAIEYNLFLIFIYSYTPIKFLLC